jgi:bis(5'-nucleosyl)-tetraphosphatase (symmetrical)
LNRSSVNGNVWIIGDLQGCHAELLQLMKFVERSPLVDQPTLHFAGDLVNRGPDSLAALRAVAGLPNAEAVLGNHDFFLLACAVGARKPGRGDTIGEILAAPDAPALLEWLRHRPLALLEHNALLVHAGLDPQWSAQDALRLAREVETELRSPDWAAFLRELWGDAPARFDESLRGMDRLRAIVNVFCRLRFCAPDGTLDFDSKEGAVAAKPGFMPWFDVPGRASADTTVVFGHWSTLGLVNRPNLIGLDTGCVWGGKLTACKLATDWTQRTFLQVRSGVSAPLK